VYKRLSGNDYSVKTAVVEVGLKMGLIVAVDES